MYDAYTTFLIKLRQVYLITKEVLSNSMADTIVIDTLLTNPMDYAEVFNPDKAQNTRKIIAEKEMYDFVVAHNSLPIIYNKTRSLWYSEAIELIDRELLELTRQESTFASLLNT